MHFLKRSGREPAGPRKGLRRPLLRSAPGPPNGASLAGRASEPRPDRITASRRKPADCFVVAAQAVRRPQTADSSGDTPDQGQYNQARKTVSNFARLGRNRRPKVAAVLPIIRGMASAGAENQRRSSGTGVARRSLPKAGPPKNPVRSLSARGLGRGAYPSRRQRSVRKAAAARAARSHRRTLRLWTAFTGRMSGRDAQQLGHVLPAARVAYWLFARADQQFLFAIAISAKEFVKWHRRKSGFQPEFKREQTESGKYRGAVSLERPTYGFGRRCGKRSSGGRSISPAMTSWRMPPGRVIKLRIS